MGVQVQNNDVYEAHLQAVDIVWGDEPTARKFARLFVRQIWAEQLYGTLEEHDARLVALATVAAARGGDPDALANLASQLRSDRPLGLPQRFKPEAFRGRAEVAAVLERIVAILCQPDTTN
jgi:hypothetical protein